MSCNIFLHGLDSSSQGTKATYFKEKFPGMLVPDFSGSLSERMDKLNSILSDKSGITLVGSSFGGLMASIFTLDNASRIKSLILLAPAISFADFDEYLYKSTDIPTILYHGTMDTVIPIEPVFERAGRCFNNLSIYKVKDDHMLHKTFKTIGWDNILG
jgi:pimeloyl-ACP methyl ester carboxylesterase